MSVPFASAPFLYPGLERIECTLQKVMGVEACPYVLTVLRVSGPFAVRVTHPCRICAGLQFAPYQGEPLQRIGNLTRRLLRFKPYIYRRFEPFDTERPFEKIAKIANLGHGG